MSAKLQQHEPLEKAIAEKLTAALLLPGSTPPRTWKVRLLSMAEPAGTGIWVQALDEKKAELDLPITTSAEVEVAFTQSHHRASFRTTILKRNKHHWVGESMVVEALLLKWPREVQSGERRKSPRYPVTDDSRVHAQLLRTGEWAPAAEREIRVKLWNVSLGGAGFVTPLNALLTALPVGEPLQVTLQHEGNRIQIPGKLASHRTVSGNTLKFGVQFESDPAKWGEGAAKGLEHLLTALARRESLRARARSAVAKAS